MFMMMMMMLFVTLWRTRNDNTNTALSQYTPYFYSTLFFVHFFLVSLVSMKEVSSNPTDYADTPMKGLEAVPSRSTIPAAVEEDRRHLVESSIVRIMKSRKSLLHHDLIAEVTRQLSSRFNPTPGAIKKRVESLIERDYLARDANDTKLYNYLA